jgi:hypothetical protein
MARVVAFIAGVTLIVTGFLHDGSDHSDRVADRDTQAAAPQSAVAPPVERQTALRQDVTREPLPQGTPASSAPDRTARRPANDPDPVIRVEWRAATQELLAIVASLTDAQKYMLGMSAMVSGQDIYAIYVRVTNVGDVPVEVSPERIQLTYAGQLVPLNRADDARFFRATRLQPNRYAEGILTFTAPIMIGGAVVAGGRLAYQDGGVQVQYAR